MQIDQKTFDSLVAEISDRIVIKMPTMKDIVKSVKKENIITGYNIVKDYETYGFKNLTQFQNFLKENNFAPSYQKSTSKKKFDSLYILNLINNV